MKNSPVPDEDVRAICALLGRGYTLQAIADRFHVTKSTVFRIAQRHKVRYVGQRPGRSQPPVKPCPEVVEVVVAGPKCERSMHFRGHAHGLKWGASW